METRAGGMATVEGATGVSAGWRRLRLLVVGMEERLRSRIWRSLWWRWRTLLGSVLTAAVLRDLGRGGGSGGLAKRVGSGTCSLPMSGG